MNGLPGLLVSGFPSVAETMWSLLEDDSGINMKLLLQKYSSVH